MKLQNVLKSGKDHVEFSILLLFPITFFVFFLNLLFKGGRVNASQWYNNVIKCSIYGIIDVISQYIEKIVILKYIGYNVILLLSVALFFWRFHR